MLRPFAAVTLTLLLAGCEAPSQVVVGGGGVVSQADVDSAWAEALTVFGGDPSWKCPVTSSRVVVVPSSLVLGGEQYFGITVWDSVDVDGVIQMVPTVEIHLRDNMACHTREVLIHEMGHLILTRRWLVDPTFAKTVMTRYESQEAAVRAMWPVEEPGICP